MNLDMFSNIDGLVLRDNSVPYADRAENNTMPDSMATMPAQTPLAMAYVPYQQWGSLPTSHSRSREEEVTDEPPPYAFTENKTVRFHTQGA